MFYFETKSVTNSEWMPQVSTEKPVIKEGRLVRNGSVGTRVRDGECFPVPEDHQHLTVGELHEIAKEYWDD